MASASHSYGRSASAEATSAAARAPGPSRAAQAHTRSSVTLPPALQAAPVTDAPVSHQAGGRSPSPLAQISLQQFLELVGMQDSFHSMPLPENLQPVVQLPSSEVCLDVWLLALVL